MPCEDTPDDAKATLDVNWLVQVTALSIVIDRLPCPKISPVAVPMKRSLVCCTEPLTGKLWEQAVNQRQEIVAIAFFITICF